MALDTLTAKANVGAGTDGLAGVNTPSGFAGAVVLVDGTGEPFSDGYALPVSGFVTVNNDEFTPVQIAGPVEITGVVPVSATELPLPDGAATETSLASLLANSPALVTTIPDNETPAPPARIVGQDIWNCSFSEVGASVLSPQMALLNAGTGIGYSQASGGLLITTGTTANQDFLARSTRTWRGSLQLRVSTVLSQRIANNNFAVLLADLIGEGLSCTINSAVSITVTKVGHGYTSQNVGQFMLIGGISGAAGVPGRYAIASVPTADTITFTVAGWPVSGSCTLALFGHSYARVLYNGTTATQTLVDTQRRGWANGDTTITVNTTASPGHIAQVHLDGRNVTFSDFLRASSTQRNVTVRGDKVENLPDDNLELYLFIWAYNGTTNPATTTTWTISFCTVEKFANLPVYIQGQRAQGAAMAAPVQVIGTAAISGSLTSAGTVTNTPVTPTQSFVNSTASTNATSVKASAGTVWSIICSNANAAARYVKFYNLAVAPTVGTSVPAFTIAVPANGTVQINGGSNGIRFGTGIALATTTGVADSDTAAVAANEIKVATSYT